ncbi:type II and III secretion system protein family protein [Reyranella sp.]|uniref:type II and III secretion system protein family protein n=1 Tax=Reyranella sp. TaxID=1929291 RepID=UPI002F95A9FD
MNIPSLVPAPPRWRQAGTTLALAASLAFVLQPYFALAQSPDSEQAPQDHTTKPKAHIKHRKASRHTPTDMVSDDLNRREAERAAQVVRELKGAAVPAAATVGEATPVAAPATTLARSAVPAAPAPTAGSSPKSEAKAGGGNTPAIVAQTAPRPAERPELLRGSIPAEAAQPAPRSGDRPELLRGSIPAELTMAPAGDQPTPANATQSTPQIAQAPAPAPAPVPIQPSPRTTAPGTPPPAAGGAPGRAFGQSQVVSPQQPTLRLEVNKGTAIKLPGPASTVFVAAPDIADVQVKSPGMIYVFAKKPGDTVLYAVDDQDRVLLNTIVSVTSPLSRVKGTLDQAHPHNGVTFDNQGETIVLGGTVHSAQVAEDARRLALQQVNNNPSKVISNIKIDAPTQVQLQVKVAEVNRNSLKRVGINWQNINNIALFGTGWLQAGFAINTILSTGGTGSGAIKLQTADGGLNSLIDFLATQSQATILAEPNLIAMSGETANFLAGGEIPVIAPQGGITNTISVTYKQVGISLNFTPTIIGDRINLKVAPEVSQVTTTGQVSVPISATASIIVPAIQTRRASTTVELASGQSFAIAGLMQRASQQDIQKMPWLGDIPVLGALFKSDAYQRNETELVIIVTPYLVEPTNGPLRTPLSGRVPPTDVDRIVYGRFNYPTPPQRLTVGQQVSGPTAGFKLN